MEREEKEREREQEEAYCKTVLYLYPHLSRMAEATKKSVYTQAVLSYRYAGGTEELAERLIELRRQSRTLSETEKEVSEIVSGFSKTEQFVLEYRYFRRKDRLRRFGESPLPFSLRTFYRRQHSVLARFCGEMRRRGLDGKWFEENFSSMDWAMTVYKKVLAGKDACLLGKRKKGLDAAKGNVRSAT